MALDYASILSAGQNLIPDLAAQSAQRQEQHARQQEIEFRKAAFAQKLDEAERERAEGQAFNADLDAFRRDPTPQKAGWLMLKHPKFADQFKQGWDVLDKDQRATNLTQMGEIFYRGQAGDYEGAAKKLEGRINADREAGHDTGDDQALLDELRSGDPQRQKEAIGMIGLHTRAGDPEGFDKLFPQAKGDTDLEKKYRFLIGERGQAYADQWLSEQTQDVVVGQPGAPVYRKSEIIGGNGFQQGGGDPASSGGPGVATTTPPAGEPVSYAMPVTGGTFTSGMGDKREGGRRHNGQDIAAPAGTPVRPIAAGTVIGVSSDPKSGNFVRVKHPDGTISSYSHLGTQAVKVGQQVDPSTTLGGVGRTGNATGNTLHLRVVKDGKNVDPRALLSGHGMRVKVRSVQEARNLPKGTKITLPDGRHGVVP